jgi:hypothetical protein
VERALSASPSAKAPAIATEATAAARAGDLFTLFPFGHDERRPPTLERSPDALT